MYFNGRSLTPTVNIEAIEMVEAQVNPLVTQLYQNLPNPFNPQTTIRYDLSEAGQVNVMIYSITGQHIRTLISEHQDAGNHQITWDGKDAFDQNVSTGIYLLHFYTPQNTRMQENVIAALKPKSGLLHCATSRFAIRKHIKKPLAPNRGRDEANGIPGRRERAFASLHTLP